MRINPTLQNLLNQQNEALKNNEICFTLYHNMDNPSKTIIRTEIRDLAYDYLKKHNKEDEANLRDIADQLGEIIFNLEIYQRSIGIFVRLDFKESSKIPSLKLNENVFILLSDIKLEEYRYIGKIFDLTSAIKILQQDSDSLVIDISRDKILLFKSKDSDFEKIGEIENKILEAMEDRYTGMHSTGENTFLHQGSAMNEKREKFSTTIINNLFEEMEKLSSEHKSNNRILIFCSADFSSHQQKIIDSLKKFSTNEPIVIQKTLKLVSDIKTQAKEELENIRLMNKDEELKNLQTSTSGTFAEDWENVSQAAREARIYQLYIKEGHHEPGYLLDNDFPYITQEENTQTTQNITPWIIKKVLETGGEVIILDKESKSMNYPIFAGLRF